MHGGKLAEIRIGRMHEAKLAGPTADSNRAI